MLRPMLGSRVTPRSGGGTTSSKSSCRWSGAVWAREQRHKWLRSEQMVESAEMVRPSVVRTSCMSNGSCMSNAGTGCAGTEVAWYCPPATSNYFLPATTSVELKQSSLTPHTAPGHRLRPPSSHDFTSRRAQLEWPTSSAPVCAPHVAAACAREPTRGCEYSPAASTARPPYPPKCSSRASRAR